VAWRTTPSTYVVCANDLAIHPDLQRLLAKRCTASVEWPVGHSPFLSAPGLVTDLVAELAGGRRARP
jgi:pimeloyl-ACP methyl ester carboxylesterase